MLPPVTPCYPRLPPVTPVTLTKQKVVLTYQEPEVEKAAADSSSDEVIPPKRKQPKAGKRKKLLGPIIAERARKKSKVKRSPSASSSSSSYLPRSSSSSSEVVSSKRVRAKPSAKAKLSRSPNQSKSFAAIGETLGDFDPCKISEEGFAEFKLGTYLDLMDWFKPGGAGSDNLSGKKLQRAKQARLRQTDPAAFRIFLDRFVDQMFGWYAKDSYQVPSHEKH